MGDMHGDSPYLIMFGPDICGPGTKKVHVIFNHKEKNHLITKEVRCKDDVFTHLYTLIDNPDYKGEWKPRQIDNPEYKGKWIHPEIDNPEYNADDAKTLGKYDEICKIGFDLWQVKSGTIFDNVLITDDIAEAKKIGDETWGATKDPEKAMKDEQDEVEKKKAEEEAAAAGAGADDEDEDLDDEDLDDIDDEDEAEPTEAHDEL